MAEQRHWDRRALPGHFSVWLEPADGDATLASDSFTNEQDARDSAARLAQQEAIARAIVYDEQGNSCFILCQPGRFEE
jgi:hypothetical protein